MEFKVPLTSKCAKSATENKSYYMTLCLKWSCDQKDNEDQQTKEINKLIT